MSSKLIGEGRDMKFKVGDICVVVAPEREISVSVRHLRGEEVQIVAVNPLSVRPYEVRGPGDAQGYAMECALRKKEPPREDRRLVKWEECLWQPNKQPA